MATTPPKGRSNTAYPLVPVTDRAPGPAANPPITAPLTVTHTTARRGPRSPRKR